MSNVNMAGVWSAVTQDSEWQQQPEKVQQAIKPFIEALPKVLSELLDKPVKLESLMAAKLAFLRYCLKHGYIKAVVDAMPDSALGPFDRKDLPDLLDGALRDAVEMAEAITSNMVEFLNQYGVTEDDVMLGPKVGLNANTQSLYLSGQLTIAQLLEKQPMVIVKNN